MNVERRYTCPKCSNRFIREDTDIGIHLPLPEETKELELKLTNLLRNYFNQTAKGYLCSSCNEISDVPYEERITNAPEALMIQLKRFKPNAKRTMIKNKVSVKISPYLQLSAYTKLRTPKSLRYQLIAVTKHTGTLNRGHYVTVGLTPRGNWIEADDSTLRRADVEAAVAPRSPWTPYLLYYKRLHGTAKG